MSEFKINIPLNRNYEMLQVKRPCAKRKMKEMADCVNLGSEKYQILMVSLSAFNAWMRNHRLATP